MKSHAFRIRWSTFLKLKRIFPAERNESVANYFERLYQHIKENEHDRRVPLYD